MSEESTTPDLVALTRRAGQAEDPDFTGLFGTRQSFPALAGDGRSWTRTTTRTCSEITYGA
jgi:hypothetical protein